MLVQDRLSPKSHKKKLAKFHSSDHKTLDFPTWVSENLYKIVAIGILIATVAAVYFIRNVVDSSALFRIETESKSMDKIEIPQIEWNLIASITDKSTPFANFRSEKWIVVSVSDYPNESIKNLAKIKGWQVLAIGNSRTPLDWSLKGTIFLSLDQQAKLGFRVVDYMPYDSYVRKSVGYLFAIQHGATKIFDADDRSEVIENNISKHFDVELIGEGSKQKILLQYSRENRNRTVVNPYIHFGQRSVWPRGLPLENVGEIGHEEYYGEVFSGKQYIQQGISNGLPDVDSVFYLTRKPVLESFDIMFDEHARKVALPQGIMVPLNSFNTLYHSPAFWGLMLPVSVSTMASDVLRGYWSQRVLWEIGGYVVVYPPTLHRYDRVESYPFAEEKDIHVNVGRMIAFLVSWRSNKHSSLFEKILELSYALAKEGFWSERDLKFTAAWLQDLIAVGYKQPRLMSSPELENPTVNNIGVHRGDKKDFVPRKLPSVHLGVEETETVNYEIGNLIRWRRSFGNVVLIMYCNGQVERTTLEWRLLYGRIFKTVVILSKEENVDLAVEEGKVDQLYKNLPNIYNRFPNAEGFLFLEDNTVLNYWNLMQADKTRLWITDKVSKSWTTVSLKGNTGWFTKQAEMINEVVSKMPVHFQVSYKESTASDHSLRICNSEVFYLPRRFVADFNDLVDLVGDLEIHQKVAIPAFFMAMDSPQNFDPILSTMIYKRKPPTNSSTFYSAEVPAIRPWTVSSEQDFIKLIRLMAAGDPLLMELV